MQTIWNLIRNIYFVLSHTNKMLFCINWNVILFFLFVLPTVLGTLAKVYLLYLEKWCECSTCLVGKTAIVTGCNTGIGYFTALDLAMRGCRVIMGCRNLEKAELARNKIIAKTKNVNVIVKIIDMESLESVRSFAEDINTTEDRLDFLVNNAGAFGLENKVTKDGLQLSVQVNFLSHVLLTHLLLGKLKKSIPSRVVNVTSVMGKISFFDVKYMTDYDGRFFWTHNMYCHAKLCMMYYTQQLSKELEGTGVTVNNCCPGPVRTGIARNLCSLNYRISVVVLYLLFKRPRSGAQTPIHLCVSTKLDNVTGKFFENCKESTYYWNAQDPTLRNEVWEKALELLKLK